MHKGTVLFEMLFDTSLHYGGVVRHGDAPPGWSQEASNLFLSLSIIPRGAE